MSTPPEVLFHRFFQTLSSSERECYKGKKDVSSLPQNQQSLLVGIQESFNEALRNESKDVPEHVDHPPFHFDYVDSRIPNALAFRYEGYSFIGITIALIDMLWDACVRLSRSETVASLLGVRLTAEEHERLHVVMLRTQLSFVLSHEYTHHVHGHACSQGSESLFFNEILDIGETGGLEQRTLEADADAYAAYHVLANLIVGGERSRAVGLLKLGAEAASVQDEVLLSCFVIAVGAYLFVRPPSDLDDVNIYRLTHPPQAARMNFLVYQAIGWCRQNRPSLEAWMTRDRFQGLMNGVAEATWGMNGGRDWGAQTAFLQSEDGSEYIRKLDRSLNAYILSL
ncbi:MAG: M48 family metalloprotease [Bryobacteraceae bacterium]